MVAKLALLFIPFPAHASAEFANPPRLSYVSYLGVRDWTPSLAIDAQGNAYVAGISGCDIAKVDPSGSMLGCLSAGAGEPLISVALDSSGFIYTVSASETSPRSATVVKLSPGGQRLYSRMIPDVVPMAITLDHSNRLYLTGAAGAGFATTPGAFRPALPPGALTGAFAMRLSPTGEIDYATYLGGANSGGSSIGADSQGQAWIAGRSESGGIVWKLDATGANLLVTQSLGPTTGGTIFTLNQIALDTSDAAYVSGVAFGGVPTTPGALQPKLLPNTMGGAGYVVKLASSGDILYGTYVQVDLEHVNYISAIAIDAAGNAYFGLNGVPARLDTPAFCGQDVTSLLMVLSADGSRILTSAYLNAGGIVSIALDGKGGVYTVETDATTDVASAKFDVTAPATSLGFSCAGSAADTAEDAAIFSEVAPGEVVILAGRGFTPTTNGAFDGYPAPVLYADWGQITAIVPFAVNGPTTQLTLSDGKDTVVMPLLVSAAIPTPFPGTIINEDGKVNFSANPAKAGSMISFYMTGAGLMTPPIADGAPGPLEPPHPVPNLGLSAYLEPTVGDPRDVVETPVRAVFQAPGLIAGVVLVTLQIPDTAPDGMMLLRLYMVGRADKPYFTSAAPGVAPVYIR
jgi:uncharacterized protein (TIGR03437 family)